MAKAKKRKQQPGGVLLTLDDLSPSIARLCVSPAGTRLAVADEEDPGEVLVVELPSGERVAHYTGLAVRARIAFRSESELFIAHGRACWCCDLAVNSHRAVPLLEDLDDTAWLYCCRASPDGKAIALGGWHLPGLLILDQADGNKPRLLSNRDPIQAVNYSPDGRLMALVISPSHGEREWQVVRVLGAQDGETVCYLKLPEIDGYEYATGFHPDNRTFAVGWQGNVLLFDLSLPKSPLDPEVLFGGDYAGYPMGWARPTACYPLGGDSGGWKQQVNGLWFSADGSALKVLCNSGEAVLMSADDGRVLQRMPPPDRSDGWGADISQAGRAAVRVGEKELVTWEVPWWAKAWGE
jgi:WD40 repeat protein